MKKRLLFTLVTFFMAVTSFSQEVTTFAGSGSYGDTDGTGAAASFRFPHGVAIDAVGNVYVADRNNYKIRKITPMGEVSTLAGSGSLGNADGLGTAASFNYPTGIAIDATGNLYVADSENHKIRKITPAGVVSTLAGSGLPGNTNGTGTSASFKAPLGVTVDAAGNVYVADSQNHKIRKITPAGVVSTFAGSGGAGSTDGAGSVASFNLPAGVAVDASGNVFVADLYNHKIRKITPTGAVSGFAGSGSLGSTDGIGVAASFHYPHGVAVNASGVVYVAGYYDNKIRIITPTGEVSTLAGSGSAGNADGLGTAASFNQPIGIAIDATGYIYVADVSNHKIRQISPRLATHFNFDGVDDFIALPNESNFDFTNQMTVEAWVKSSVAPEQWDALVTKGDNSWRLHLNSTGTVNFACSGTTSPDVNSTSSVTDGNWHHVVGTLGGNSIKIYIDGVLENVVSTSGNINNTVNQVLIGNNQTFDTRLFNGNIDEVRIWNVARTAEQINGSKNCELQGNETGLVAYYKFNQGLDAADNTAITTLTDATANVNNGTLVNFAKTGTTSNFLAGSPVTMGSTAPTASAQSFCGATTANRLVPAISATIKWYASATATTALATTDNLTTGTYYVVAVNANGCESTRTSAVITVNAIPTAPTGSAQSFCGATTANSLVPAISATIKWYASATATTALATTNNLTTRTYYVVAVNVNGCESDRVASTVTITNPQFGSGKPEILYYKFDGTGTSVPNLASAPPAGAENATILGAITQGGSGNTGGALNGSGVASTTDYLNTNWNTNLGTNSWSIAFWSSGFSSTATFYYIFGDNSAGSFRCFTDGSAGSNNWTLRGNGITDVSIYGGAVGTPSLCVFVYDNVANKIKAYLNGVLVSTVNQTAGAVNIVGTAPFKVMGYSSNFGVPVGGKLDDFGLFSRVLTLTEIQNLYQQGVQTNQEFCNGATVANLQPNTSSTVKWYASATGGTELATSEVLTTGLYYATPVIGTCEGARTTVNVTTTSNATTQNAGVVTATENASGVTYQWYQCGTPNVLLTGETNQTYTPTANGDYYVQITKGTCVVSSVCETTLGNSNFEINSGLSIYPNPSKGIFNISIQEDANVTVNDILGKVIYTKKVKAGNNTIDISNYQSGMYLLNIINENGSVTKKLIKE